VDEHTRSESLAPLILRRVPPARVHLARVVTGLPGRTGAAPGTWWELVDPAAAPGVEPAAAALTLAHPDGSVSLTAVRAGHAGHPQVIEDLLRALTAALRGRAVDLVVARTTEHDLVRALRDAGFTRVPGDDDFFVLAL
jgi:hypothetical protein